MINRRTLAALATSAALAALWPSSTFAAQNNFPSPGTPNCEGQLIAYGASHGHPLGQVAKLKGVSVQTLHAKVDAYCQV